MVWERRNLVDQETQSSDAATFTKKLPASGFLSAIGLRARMTNGSTNGEEHLISALDRIEVIGNGSEVLFSLEGVELFRWAWAQARKVPSQIWTEAAGAVQEVTLPILFGRYAGDPAFNLDLSQFRDVELRVEYSPTIAVGAFATGTFQIHAPMLIAPPSQPPIARRGWLRTTQQYAWSTAASGDERVELPRRYPIWDALVYCREGGIAEGVDISRVQLEVDDGRLIAFTGRWDDLQAENESLLGINSEINVRALRADADVIGMLTGRIKECSVQHVGDYAAAADYFAYFAGSIAGDQITISGLTHEASSTWAASTLDTTERDLMISARGMGIGNAVLLPFALYGGEDQALDAPSMDKLELVATQGGAGGTARVSIRELVA